MNELIDRPIQFRNSITRKRIAKSTITGLFIWATVVILQSLIFWGEQDPVVTLMLLAGGSMGVVAFFKSNYLKKYPLATLMMMGYVSYYFLLPPLATILEGKPVSYRLQHPTLIYTHATICLIFFIVAFTIYRKSIALQKLRWFISKRIYQPIGFFNRPSNTHLLLMGSVGLLAIGYEYFIAGVYQHPSTETIDKFIQGFYPLAYLPYVILLNKIIGKEKRSSRTWIFILVIYSALLGIVSLAWNSRAALLMGVASIVLAYLYGLATGLYKLSKNSVRKIAIAIFVIIILAGPITDLAISMVIVRGIRTQISASELVAETFKTFLDKETIAHYRKDMLGYHPPDWYDWSYVNNLFLDRLSNLKFADINLDIALSVGKTARAYLREIEIQKILAILPQPIISILKLPVDKNMVTSASSGDFMIYAATGNRYALGGFQTGSLFANGYVLFDWGYPVLIMLLMLLVFALNDALTTQMTSRSQDSNPKYWKTVLSCAVIIDLFSRFFYLTSAATGSESISSILTYLIRGWIQLAFIYGITYWLMYIPQMILIRGISGKK